MMRGAGSPVTGALLGLLLERPSYGYELAQRVDARMGPAWRLTTSSIYPVLDRLESDQLIERAVKDLPGRSRQRERIMYHATDAAPDAFARWMQQPVRKEPIRTELLAKIAVARPEDVPALLAALDEYERSCLDLLAAAGSAPAPDDAWLGVVAGLVAEAADQHLRADLAWVALARRRLREFASESGR
jgi:DNA-binding PadR family transcriptional regulator